MWCYSSAQKKKKKTLCGVFISHCGTHTHAHMHANTHRERHVCVCEKIKMTMKVTVTERVLSLCSNAVGCKDPCSWLHCARPNHPSAAASRSENNPTQLWGERESQRERDREREQCQKPSVSHLCSDLRPTLLTEPVSRYAFGHPRPPPETLKAAPNSRSHPMCWLRPLGITVFTPALSPPAGSDGGEPLCAAVSQVRAPTVLPQDGCPLQEVMRWFMGQRMSRIFCWTKCFIWISKTSPLPLVKKSVVFYFKIH